MSLVEKVKHERVRGRALTKDEINKLLDAAENEIQRDVIKFYIYTSCRVDEISATKVKYINLTNEPRIITNFKTHGKPVPDMKLLPNEILIHGTKTKLSIRTTPIMPPLRPILEKLIKGRNGDLINITQFLPTYHSVLRIIFILGDAACATNKV